MTDDELKAIEARALAAFKHDTGEMWIVFGEHHSEFSPDGTEYDVDSTDGRYIAQAYGRDRAEFLAHARTDVPALIATVRMYRAEYEKATKNYIDAVGKAEKYRVALEKRMAQDPCSGVLVDADAEAGVDE